MSHCTKTLRCVQIGAAFAAIFMAAEAHADEPIYSPGVPSAVLEQPAPKFEETLPKTDEEIRTWSRDQLSYKNYEGLEKAANHWRESKEISHWGIWKLTVFYEGIAPLPGNRESHEDWFINSREWVKKMPKSITARIVLASILKSYAWEARGSGSFDGVSDDNFQLFQDRLEESLEVLREARKLDAKCPQWWAAAQDIALGQEWSESKYKWLFEQAIAFEPEYFPYYTKKNWHLFPRWFGAEGDAPKFAFQAANKLGGEKGNLLYAVLIQQYYDRDPDMLSDPAISFEKLDLGFAVMSREIFADISTRVTWAKLCMMTGTSKNEAVRKARVHRIIKQLEKRDPKEESGWRGAMRDAEKWAAT